MTVDVVAVVVAEVSRNVVAEFPFRDVISKLLAQIFRPFEDILALPFIQVFPDRFDVLGLQFDLLHLTFVDVLIRMEGLAAKIVLVLERRRDRDLVGL